MEQKSYLESLFARAALQNKTIVLPEGEDQRVLTAAHLIRQKNIARIIILGNSEEISKFFAQNHWDLEGITLINPASSDRLSAYADLLYELRKDKGMSREEALQTALIPNYFGTLMIKAGDADGMVSGANHSTAETVRPALQIIKSAKKGQCVSSFFIMVCGGIPYIFSDCAIVINPDQKELADIAIQSAESAIQFDIPAEVAMLSYSTKGSGTGESVDKVKNAVKLAQETAASPEYADLNIHIDGELQGDAALDLAVGHKKAPGSNVAGQARVLIFPDINAGNISYKLVQRLGGADAYGPVLQGLNAPVNDLSRGTTPEDIVGTVAITVIQSIK